MLAEFFGVNGFAREPEGFLSWQHLTFVTLLMACMAALAMMIGLQNRHKDARARNRVLIAAALLLDGIEIARNALMCLLNGTVSVLIYALPLYVCSLHFFMLPLAAFSRGRLKQASVDFVCMFGLIGAVLGTYAAGNTYAMYPVLSSPNVLSGITHAVAGFASLYIMLTGMAGTDKNSKRVAHVIVICICACAYGVNLLMDTNYMFIMSGEGTLYDVLYNLVGRHPVLYPLGVWLLLAVYIELWYGISARIRHATVQSHKDAVL